MCCYSNIINNIKNINHNILSILFIINLITVFITYLLIFVYKFTVNSSPVNCLNEF